MDNTAMDNTVMDNAVDNTATDSTPVGQGLLAGKVAFITGAGRGIGAAAARLFAQEGARVLLAARTEAQLNAVTEQISVTGAIVNNSSKASASTPSHPAIRRPR